MTRLRFLLVSFLAACCAALGFDRERMARAWLKENGFEILLSERMVDGVNRFTAICHHPKIGVSGSWMTSSPVPIQNIATIYVQRLARGSFTIVQVPFVYRQRVDGGWKDLTGNNGKPVTFHRFPRPWWA